MPEQTPQSPFAPHETAGFHPVEVDVVSPTPEVNPEADQMIRELTGITEGLMDAYLNGQSVEGLLVGYVQGHLEQHAGQMSEEDIARLSDKRLALIRRQAGTVTSNEPVVMPQSEPESSKTISAEELQRLRDQG